MANNCLVTKLKSVVDNNNLEKLGEFKLKVANGKLVLNVLTENYTITGLNGVLIDGVASKTVAGGWSGEMILSGLPTNDTIGTVVINAKYYIAGILGSIILEGSDALTYVPVTEIMCRDYAQNNVAQQNVFELSKYISEHPTCKSLKIGGTGVTGSISDMLSVKDILTTFQGCFGVWGSHISGTLAELGHLYKVNDFTAILPNNPAIQGKIEDFVSSRLQEKPATAGLVYLGTVLAENNITYYGTAITSVNNCNVAWDTQGVITLTVDGQVVPDPRS